MDISRSIYTDMIFHIFAHFKVDNASDIYDEEYISDIEKAIGKKTVIPKGVNEYYCANFERLAYINFLPYFMFKSVDELCYVIEHSGMITEEDRNCFIAPFCGIIRDIHDGYAEYWNRSFEEHSAIYEGVEEYFNQQIEVMHSFFETLKKTTNLSLKIILSESLRCNGRASMMGDTHIITLPLPGEKYSLQDIFLQLVHECTHALTDPLLNSIRMDDGSHDLAEYQVMLYDLWLFQRDNAELCEKYTEWATKEVLDMSNQNLPKEQMERLRERFDGEDI